MNPITFSELTERGVQDSYEQYAVYLYDILIVIIHRIKTERGFILLLEVPQDWRR